MMQVNHFISYDVKSIDRIYSLVYEISINSRFFFKNPTCTYIFCVLGLVLHNK